MNSQEIIPIIKDGIYNEDWQLHLTEFPPLIELERRLEYLMTIDKSKMSRAQIRDLVYQNIVLLPNYVHYIEKDRLNIQSFWRTRKNVCDHEDLTLINTFSYPKFCTSNGRANLKEQPIFYCSTNRSTSLFESKPEVGEIIYLSEWKPNCDRTARVRFLLSENMDEGNPFFQLQLKHLDVVKQMSKSYGMQNAAHLEMVTRFLANSFVKECPPYMLSSWLANEIMFGNLPVDILFYPSICTFQKHCNLAIAPTFVDKYLIPTEILKMEVLEFGVRNIKTLLLGTGIVEGEKINWTDEFKENEFAKPSQKNHKTL